MVGCRNIQVILVRNLNVGGIIVGCPKRNGVEFIFHAVSGFRRINDFRTGCLLLRPQFNGRKFAAISCPEREMAIDGELSFNGYPSNLLHVRVSGD